ncbi:hypothetical protein A2U01_0094672, partial [Trifolium medium]|nr:hypothetical protein [Trifolium medium]
MENWGKEYNEYQQRHLFSEAALGLEDNEQGTPFHMDPGGSS